MKEFRITTERVGFEGLCFKAAHLHTSGQNLILITSSSRCEWHYLHLVTVYCSVLGIGI